MAETGTIRVVGTGEQATYRIEVSGTLSEHKNSLEDSQEVISDNKRVATGQVSVADDIFEYTREVVGVQIKGDARVVIDPPQPDLHETVRTIVQDELSTHEFEDADTTVDKAQLVSQSGIHVAGGAEWHHSTIQGAWDAASSGDQVYVHSSYDAQSGGESFPIELDYLDKEVHVRGGHPSGSVIDAGDTDANVLEIKGTGAQDYQNSPVVSNLTLKGGSVGLRILGAPFSSYQNLLFHQTGSHGIELCEREINGSKYGTFGSLLINCQAWNCGGNGFHLNTSAAPHGTTFTQCKATACTGMGFRLAGACVSVLGGGTQLNYGFGIRANSTMALDIESVYIEGNSRRTEADAPTEVYLSSTDGTHIEDCYFHGINPRGANHDFKRVQRGISAHDSPGLTVSDCVVRRYGQGFLSLFGCADAEVAPSSHTLMETGLWAVEPDYTARIRSNGVILPCDLSQVTGTFDGDAGLYLKDDGSIVPKWWHNGAWKTPSGYGQ